MPTWTIYQQRAIYMRKLAEWLTGKGEHPAGKSGAARIITVYASGSRRIDD